MEKIVMAKNGASAMVSGPHGASGMYEVNVRAPNGELHDKVRCDDRMEAMQYFRAFTAIAKNHFKA